MAALDATIGGAASNSYVTEVEADDYFSSRTGADSWANLESSDKESALISATYTLDDSFNFIGTRTNKDGVLQALDWPRITPIEDLEDDVIPFKIQRAQMEIALEVSVNGAVTSSASLDSVKVGSIEVDFDESNPTGMIPDSIQTIVYPLGSPTGPASGGSSITQVPLVR